MKKIIYIAVLLISGSLFSQKNVASKSIDVPIEVKDAFRSEFNDIMPVWKMDYEGPEGNYPRYIALFRKDGTDVVAYYSKEGIQKVIEFSISLKKLPKNIKRYLRENYPTYKINEIFLVKKSTVKMYEVGIGSETKFFDVQFDASGDFLQIVEKNKH